MALSLNMLNAPVQWNLLRKGHRIFALLGKATPSGLGPFSPEDLADNWAVTAEHGCLRLEHLVGDEEVIGDQLFLPTPFSNEYGILGEHDSPDLVRAVFGLLPSELEQLLVSLRRGNFPLRGFSRTQLTCGLTSCVIPGYWPHVVLSQQPMFGNTVCIEAFLRIVVASLPQGQLTLRFPALQPVLKQMMKLLIAQRRGVPYTREMLDFVPAAAPAPQ